MGDEITSSHQPSLACGYEQAGSDRPHTEQSHPGNTKGGAGCLLVSWSLYQQIQAPYPDAERIRAVQVKGTLAHPHRSDAS